MDFSRTTGFYSPLDDIKKENERIVIDGGMTLRSVHQPLQTLAIPTTSRWVGNVPNRSLQTTAYGFMFNLTSTVLVTAVGLDSRTSDGQTTPCNCRILSGNKFVPVLHTLIDRTRMFGSLYLQDTNTILTPGTYYCVFDLKDNNNLLQWRGNGPNVQRPVLDALPSYFRYRLGSIPGTENLVEACMVNSNNANAFDMVSLRTAPNNVAAFCGTLFVDEVTRSAILSCERVNTDLISCSSYTSTGGKFLQVSSISVNRAGSLVGPGFGNMHIKDVGYYDHYEIQCTFLTTQAGVTLNLLMGDSILCEIPLEKDIVTGFAFEFRPTVPGLIDVVCTKTLTGTVTMQKCRLMKTF